MKADIHPNYRHVVFRDISCDFEFLTKSSIETDKTTEYEGNEYPLVVVDISSKSHPFYTGTQKIMDIEGRVDRFYRKYGFKRAEGEGEQAEAAAETPAAETTAETPAAEAPAAETTEGTDEASAE